MSEDRELSAMLAHVRWLGAQSHDVLVLTGEFEAHDFARFASALRERLLLMGIHDVLVVHLQPGMTVQALHGEEMAQHGW